jgi:hypothetical protein
LVLQIGLAAGGLAFAARKARSFVSTRNFELMNDRMPPPLTPDELASLLNIAVEMPPPKIPPILLARLVLSGYVQMGPDGPQVTGDGLIRITDGG